MKLTAKRIELVRTVKKHAEEIVALINEDNEILSRWTTIPYPNKTNDTEEFIKKTQRKKDHFLFFVLEKETKKGIGLIDIKINYMNKSGVIGYWLGKKFRNKGYMTEAVKRMLWFGFEKRDLNKIIIRASPDNKASIKVIEKNGLKYEGLLRDECRNGFGEYLDLKTYSILRREWKE